MVSVLQGAGSMLYELLERRQRRRENENFMAELELRRGETADFADVKQFLLFLPNPLIQSCLCVLDGTRLCKLSFVHIETTKRHFNYKPSFVVVVVLSGIRW